MRTNWMKFLKKFKTLLIEERRDALKSTIIEVKQHMAWQFSSMAAADTKVVMACIKDHTCSHLRGLEYEKGATAVDPDEEIPSGPEVLQWLPPEKRYTNTIRDHIISIFDHIANAQSEASLATANISALPKVADADTLDVVLRAVVRPLVQINWPEKYLSLVNDPKASSMTEEKRKNIIINLLPNREAGIMEKEPRNNPTWLLTLVVYLKLKRMFLNEGTQREMEEKFLIHSKQLCKLLSGKCYLGGKDKKGYCKKKKEEP